MAAKFITVRRIDDPTVTAEISPRALRHFPDWERVPADEPDQTLTESADKDADAGVEATKQDAGSAPEPPKKRRAAATDSKE
jgi:hypothetical protein